jgi:RimJ/RimL family protein N-acetyltransferase
MIDARNYDVKEILRDGQSVTIRAIRPDDKALLLEGFHEVSQYSLYLRFFQMKKEMTDQELKFLTEVDFIHHVALVAITDLNGRDKLIGGGRYVAYDDPGKPYRAELAFMVHDKYQGHGIATLIMKHLLVIARDQGISQFEAEVLAENEKMLTVFSHTGLTMSRSRLNEVIHVTLSLSADVADSEERVA